MIWLNNTTGLKRPCCQYQSWCHIHVHIMDVNCILMQAQ